MYYASRDVHCSATSRLYLFFGQRFLKTMIKLTKENAIELNDLFDKLLNWKGEKILSLINVFDVVKAVDTLKDKPEQYIRSLLYLARQEQKNIPELFSGDTLIALFEPSVRDFLAHGGFLTIYENRLSEIRKDKGRFWITNGLVIIAILISIYQVCVSTKSSQQEPQKEKQLKQEPPPLNQDSTKMENPKTIPKNDSTKK